jgi:hypothetical protein
VTSNPTGINCGSTCQAQFADGQSVVLTATPSSGGGIGGGNGGGDSSFGGWTGCDSVSGNQCTVAMTSNRAVTATFNAGAGGPAAVLFRLW